MGYTLELWAVPPGALTAELSAPTIDPRRVEFTPYGPSAEEFASQWPRAARTVAQAIRNGGGAAGGDLALYVQFAVRTVGAFQGSLNHSSAGGEQFRRRFLAGPAAALLGLDNVGRLLNRDIAGLTWPEYPSFGWAAPAELAGAVARFPGIDLGAIADDEDDIGALHILLVAARRAVQLGWDLVGVYG